MSLMLAIVLMMVPQLATAANTTIPKTSPPPLVFKPKAVYTGYTYLYTSAISTVDNKDQTVTITATTTTKVVVSTIGASVQLQKWTGSAWINVGTVKDLFDWNTSALVKTSTKYTESGYYFRAKVTHYATHNGTTESVIEYSSSFLAQ
ncbi:hypothetical protein ACU063_13770 [Paenibacillus sp. M.A.Huq-81]